MRVLIDTTPLRVSRDFRRLWIGQAVSFLGSTMTAAALPYQVYHQTNSSLAVGLLGVAQLGPLLVFSIIGGALADSIDKRVLLIGVTFAAMACSVGLAVNASLDQPQLWLLYVLGAAASGVIAVTFPVLRSLLPLLLEESLAPGRVRIAVDVRLVRHDGRAGDRWRADRHRRPDEHVLRRRRDVRARAHRIRRHRVVAADRRRRTARRSRRSCTDCGSSAVSR